MRLILLSLIALVTSCASKYEVRVDSISRYANPTGSFAVISGMKDIANDDLRFQEFANVVSNGLKKKGFVLVTENERPDFVVLLNYGISRPQTSTHVSSSPVYGSRTSYVNNIYGQQIGSVNSYGVQSYRTQTYDVTNYTRYVLLKAYNSEEKELWQTTITSTGTSSDLRQVFPFMVHAAVPFFGVTTDKQEEIEVSELWNKEDANSLRSPASNSTTKTETQK